MQSHLTQGDCLLNLFYKLLKPPQQPPLQPCRLTLSSVFLACLKSHSILKEVQVANCFCKANNVSVYHFGSFRGLQLIHISHVSNVRYFTTTMMAPRSALHIPGSSRLGVAAPTEVSPSVRSLEAPVRLRGGAVGSARSMRSTNTIRATRCAFDVDHLGAIHCKC